MVSSWSWTGSSFGNEPRSFTHPLSPALPFTKWPSLSSVYISQAKTRFFRLWMQTARLPCSRALVKAGINIAINNAMMAITTKSSIKVNPVRKQRLTSNGVNPAPLEIFLLTGQVSSKDSFRRKLSPWRLGISISNWVNPFFLFIRTPLHRTGP